MFILANKEEKLWGTEGPYMKEKEVMLERIVLQAQEFLGPEEIKNGLHLELVPDKLIGGIRARLSLYIRGEQLQNNTTEITFRYPKNWWEHFKKAKFPKWLLKKYPVEYDSRTKKVTFKVGEFIPMLSKYLAIPKSERLYFQSLEYDNYSSYINMEEEN